MNDDLLSKYIDHVGSCEGVSFIDYWRFQSDSDGIFSDDEILQLYLLNGETKEQFEADRKRWQDDQAD